MDAVQLTAEEKKSSGHVVSLDNRRILAANETNSFLLVNLHQPTDPVPPEIAEDREFDKCLNFEGVVRERI